MAMELTADPLRGRVSDRAPEGRLLLGSPLFYYRRTAYLLGSWLWGVARRRPDILDRWLKSCEAVGLLWGGWKRYLKKENARAER